MKATCGIDWSERRHDVALVDAGGKLVARKRITDDAAGWRALLELFAAHGDTPAKPFPVAIETGRTVYAINPLAVARYRERHTVARSKSDHADAMTMANILRRLRASHDFVVDCTFSDLAVVISRSCSPTCSSGCTSI